MSALPVATPRVQAQPQPDRQVPLYTPILRGLLAEIDALEMMNPSTRSLTYPLLEMASSTGENPPRPGDLMRKFAQLALRWMGPIMVDGCRLTPRSTRGATALATVTREARGLLRVVPVIRLGDGEIVRRDAAAAVAQDGQGMAVRIAGADLFADPHAIDLAVADLIRQVRVAPEQVDLVFDLALVEGPAAVAGGSMLADHLIGGLSRIARYRTLIVSSGSFPVDLRDVIPWTVTPRSRDDAAMWRCLLARRPARVPVYGDYAITHPVMTPTNPGRPSPQLRYTVADRWLILRGRRRDQRGSAQFYDVCDEMSGHPEFSGVELGQADQRIANARLGGPGNATTWRCLGTAHHADFVVSRLTALGVP